SSVEVISRLLSFPLLRNAEAHSLAHRVGKGLENAAMLREHAAVVQKECFHARKPLVHLDHSREERRLILNQNRYRLFEAAIFLRFRGHYSTTHVSPLLNRASRSPSPCLPTAAVISPLTCSS